MRLSRCHIFFLRRLKKSTFDEYGWERFWKLPKSEFQERRAFVFIDGEVGKREARVVFPPSSVIDRHSIRE